MITKLDSPPYEVNPNVLKRFDAKRTVFSRRSWDEEAEFYGKSSREGSLEMIASDKPGYSRVDLALSFASWTVSNYFSGARSREKLGKVNWIMERLGQHSVADTALMSQQVKQAAHMFGAVSVGICRLDHRWVYSHNGHGDPIETPSEYERAIVMAVPMDVPTLMESPTFFSEAATGNGYSRMSFSFGCMAEFIRHLGYKAIPMANDTALSIPLAIDAGLGELGRNGLLITPGYGACVRLCKVFTDLPLDPDRPIEFGVSETCRRCRKCAEACENDAIQSDPEPSYRVACRSNNEGVLRWAVNQDKCYTFWVENGASCSTCISACPYTPRIQQGAT